VRRRTEFCRGVLEGIVLVGSVALVVAFMALLTVWRFGLS
jgi:hypothetical protein